METQGYDPRKGRAIVYSTTLHEIIENIRLADRAPADPVDPDETPEYHPEWYVG